MKKYALFAAVGILAVGTGVAVAELPEDYAYVDPPSDDHPLSEIISGYEFRGESVQQMQDDEFENPGYLMMDLGQELWDTADGSADRSCADCHGDVENMIGVGSTYPKMVGEGERRTLRNIENQINTCRTEQMGADAWRYDSDELLGMTILVRNQDNGEPVNVAVDGDAADWFARGEELYYTRTGQLDMSCSHCHEQHYGQYLRADHLSQGQSNGFPTYRLKWGGVGSLHRRLEGCVKDTRATPYARGSDELLALELYLAWRGQGLPVETPAVRN